MLRDVFEQFDNIICRVLAVPSNDILNISVFANVTHNAFNGTPFEAPLRFFSLSASLSLLFSSLRLLQRVFFFLTPSYISFFCNAFFRCAFCSWAFRHVSYCRDSYVCVACFRCACWFLLFQVAFLHLLVRVACFPVAISHVSASSLSSAVSYNTFFCMAFIVCLFFRISSCPDLSYSTFCSCACVVRTFLFISLVVNPSLLPFMP